uniref:Stabilin 2 n=1 Tax=Labrus bergylta TaxID=56723 RepID=A0A3Q3FGG4_9LABR
ILLCRYYIRTSSMELPMSGCSFECHREAKLMSCCPGFWGADCIGQFMSPCCLCSCVHGLCDSGLTGSGSCTCFSGYKGPNCDQESTACKALTCQQNARCMEQALTGQLVCQCLPGYQRSGDQCLSINPCLQPLCHNHATCVHSGPNQHVCACNEGYSGDGQVCMAVDPCQSNQGGCSTGTARCVYDGPGKVGKQQRPCPRSRSGSSQSLLSTFSNSVSRCFNVCTCLQGYIGNGKVCYGNIIQRLNNLNTEPGGEWRGQLSDAIQLFGVLSWPLQSLGPFTLFVPINKGFRGTSVRTLTADVSKAKYLCKMHLVAGVMPFSTLKKTNVFYTLTGKSAEIDTSEGDSQTKIRLHGSRKKGVILRSDLVASNGIIHIINKLMDSVSPTVDSNTKVYTHHMHMQYSLWQWFSTSGWGPKSGLQILDTPGPITVFAPSSSAFDRMTEGHLEYLSSAEVRTPSGQIFVDDAPVLEAAVEAKNGRLYVIDGVLTPSTIQPVLPHRCDINKTKLFRVSFNRRHFFNDALKSHQQVTPACCKGFYGPDCSPCPGGHQTPCSGHGQCSEGMEGSGLCVCEQNFRGSRCQYCTAPNKYGPNCDRTCPCVHGQCDNHPDSGGQCKLDSCQMGYTGALCDRRTAACGVQAQFCHAHADCDFSQGTPRCVCQPGYQGDGITCVESDPCAPPLRGGCSLNAKCVTTGPGTHSCQCLIGWTEDGDECQPINNCNRPDKGGCHSNATCIYVGPGRSDCSCKAGYKGSGWNCEAVNQCVTANGGCHYLASCLLQSSQWTCVCDEGYVGNGQTCYGTIGQVRVHR